MQGHTLGLKKNHLQALKRITRRRVPRQEIASWELVKLLSSLSRELRKQIGVLIDRKGHIDAVVVGDHHSLELPPPTQERVARTRLSGHRLVHTHLGAEGLTRDDLTDLGVYRLDLVASVSVDAKGFPGEVHLAHINPAGDPKRPVTRLDPLPYLEIDLPFDDFVKGLEEELRRRDRGRAVTGKKSRGILCAMFRPRDPNLETQLAETKELAWSAGLEILDTFIQTRDKPDPKYLIGRGKLREISLRAVQLDVDLLLFHQNLRPNQARLLTDETDLKILDRTQLILDIFAQRAKSHDGKLQVELAQLRYTLPRLREWNTQMSRLVGGIGGQGPGETKLEIHRRRARERSHRLEKEIEQIARKRAQKRGLRKRKSVPIVSIVGYTNAGKSTLLNTLTQATALVENKLFATLDPFSKRLRFPRDREVILTDTVGFIRDLPPDLMTAFRATLEEIGDADLLLHVVDVSDPAHARRISVVNDLLAQLGFDKILQLLTLNKTDLMESAVAERLARTLDGVPICALEAESTRALLIRMETMLWSSHANRSNSSQIDDATGSLDHRHDP